MGAYGAMEKAVAGLKSGLDARVESFKAGEIIAFGRALFGYAADAITAWLYKNDRSTVTLDADLVAANVATWTVTVDGVAYNGAVTYATSHQATMGALVAAIQAAVPNSVVTLSATPFRVYTVDVDGKTVVATLVITLGVSQAGVTVANSSRQVFLGISMFDQKEGGNYASGDSVNVLVEGQIYVTTAASVNANTAAYVVQAAGATVGLFTPTAASNYDTKCRFRETVSGAGLALLEVRGQN